MIIILHNLIKCNVIAFILRAQTLKMDFGTTWTRRNLLFTGCQFVATVKKKICRCTFECRTFKCYKYHLNSSTTRFWQYENVHIRWQCAPWSCGPSGGGGCLLLYYVCWLIAVVIASEKSISNSLLCSVQTCLRSLSLSIFLISLLRCDCATNATCLLHGDHRANSFYLHLWNKVHLRCDWRVSLWN